MPIERRTQCKVLPQWSGPFSQVRWEGVLNVDWTAAFTLLYHTGFLQCLCAVRKLNNFDSGVLAPWSPLALSLPFE